MVSEREGGESSAADTKSEGQHKDKEFSSEQQEYSLLPTEKLNRSNYASWSYKMHQYLLGHGYWSYVEGANDAAKIRHLETFRLGSRRQVG